MEVQQLTDQRVVRVCDDNGSRAERWASEIAKIPDVSARFKVEALLVDEFAEAFDELKSRQRQARVGPPLVKQSALDKLDQAEIVISDFDLTPADGSTELAEDTLKTLSGSFGDVFSYLVRNYTDASYTVLANQAFFQSTFDLSHMRFTNSNADLNVAGDDLRRPELWTGVSDGTTYRPWHWPRLLDAAEQRHALVSSLDLEAPVLATLGLADTATIAQFSPEQIEFLGPNPEALTFKDACSTAGKFGRSTEHEKIPDKYMAQAAVAVISHWLERVVMPGQNVTIDAPHLAQRRPGALKHRDPQEWAVLCDLTAADDVRDAFVGEAIEGAEIPELAGWTSRPVWMWHQVPRNLPGAQTGTTMVFCEDVSAFHPVDDAWEYESSVPSPFNQRFVLYETVKTDGYDIEYWPQRRLFD